MEHYSVIKPNGIISFAATWMDLEIITLNVKSDIYNMLPLIMWNLKYDTDELIYKRDSQTLVTDLWLPEGRREMDWEFDISRCKALYTGWINNKVLLYHMVVV